MSDPVDRLAKEVASRLRRLGFFEPARPVIVSFLELAYLASLKSEEGRFVQGSLTFADPLKPDADPPFPRRADAPAFVKFGSRETLTVEGLVKLARAIDKWSGSIAVYATSTGSLFAWGVVDQLVQQNIKWNLESDSGPAGPGVLTVTIDGIGDISAYHGDVFLGGIKAHVVVGREHDALGSVMIQGYAARAMTPMANTLAAALGKPDDQREVLTFLVSSWARSLARLCIGLRRFGTGGAFLLTAKPVRKALKEGHVFSYVRLRDSLVLQIFDQYHSWVLDEQRLDRSESGAVPSELISRLLLARAQVEERQREVTGAVKMITSLATVDGLVLMTPELTVAGFGTKISAKVITNGTPVYDAQGFVETGTRARRIDLAHFGTRHSSMLSYCARDPKALGIVISQDGYVRFVMRANRSIVLWDDIKLLGNENYSSVMAGQRRKDREINKRSRDRYASSSSGLTVRPTTIAQLTRLASKTRKK